MELGFGDLIKTDDRVWLSDGVGMGVGARAELSDAARVAGGIRLVLGWCPGRLDGLDLSAFADVRTIMGGYGLRRPIDEGVVHYIPVRLSNIPALIAGPLTPDVVVVAATEEPDGYGYGPEVGWLPAAVESGATVGVVVGPALPSATGERIRGEGASVVGESREGATELPAPFVSDVHRVVGEAVARHIPLGATVQYGPGPIGAAVLEALVHPVHIDTGMITDAVLGLQRRGMLIGRPLATYLAGSEELYDWSLGQDLLRRVEVTHNPGRLAARPCFTAVNTALQIDYRGQVNVERIGDSAVGGVGGHPDYAAAASRHAEGLSIVALVAQHGDAATLVPQLEAPASTARHDVDLVVTERGEADLRGLSDDERERALRDLWAG